MKTKHPVYIMVFGLVTNDGDIMPLFIFPYSLRLNMETCIKIVLKRYRMKFNLNTFPNRAQLAGAVEYMDCISAEG